MKLRRRFATACIVGAAVGALATQPVGAGELLAIVESEAAGTPAIVAVPGSRAGTYGTPVVVVEKGDDLTFVNMELFAHDVRSVAVGPDNTPWCNPAEPSEPQHPVKNPRRFAKGKCPLLWSLPISMTVGAVETKVYGTNNLKPGTTVKFYCTVFPSMQGQVIVR